MDFIQDDFSGGMNLFGDLVKIAENEYGSAFNIRNRTIGLTTIKSPVEDTTLPAGKKQGIYAFDIYVLAFVAGYGYFKNILTDSAWTKIADLELDPTVDYIYTQLVPASSIDFKRSLINDNQNLGSAQSIPLKFEIVATNGSLSGLVVQDGIGQPWFILADGTARRLQTYDQWTLMNDRREYVPIMRQMAYVDGILFGVANDGITLYRSVSGRPLDFVVNVTSTGDKGGNADTTSYSLGQNQINALNQLSTGELIVGTNKTITLLELNYDKTIFAEPTFTVAGSYSIGILNHFCFVKYGNSTNFLMDIDGLRSFVTGQTDTENEGRNSTFVATVAKALILKQTIGCVIIFDDYTLYSCGTTYSDTNLIAVYDNNRQQWVGFDDNVLGSIKQFAIANQSLSPTLYAITDSVIYKMFIGPISTGVVTLKERTLGTVGTHLLNDVNIAQIDGSLIGIVSAQVIENGNDGNTVDIKLKGLKTETSRFNFLQLTNQAWRIGLKLTWNNDSVLSIVQLTTTPQTQATSVQQQSKIYARS